MLKKLKDISPTRKAPPEPGTEAGGERRVEAVSGERPAHPPLQASPAPSWRDLRGRLQGRLAAAEQGAPSATTPTLAPGPSKPLPR